MKVNATSQGSFRGLAAQRRGFAGVEPVASLAFCPGAKLEAPGSVALLRSCWPGAAPDAPGAVDEPLFC